MYNSQGLENYFVRITQLRCNSAVWTVNDVPRTLEKTVSSESFQVEREVQWDFFHGFPFSIIERWESTRYFLKFKNKKIVSCYTLQSCLLPLAHPFNLNGESRLEF